MLATTLLQRLLAPHMRVSDALLAAFADRLEPVSLPAGAILHDFGAPCTDMLLLAGGIVRAYYIHDAREVNLRLLCAPSVVTAMASLITGTPSEEWVEAITPVDGYRVDLAALEAPPFDRFADRIRRVLAEQHYLALERRLRTLQWKSVAERYAYFTAHLDPQIVANTPAYHVASYLGTTPETLSRVKRRRDDG